MGLNEDAQVDGSVGDQNDDALSIQVESVVDMSSGHLESGILTRACIESHPDGKLLPEGKSQCSIFGIETKKELPSVLGVYLQLESNFFTSLIDKRRFFMAYNRVKGHETEMHLLGDPPNGLEMHAHDAQGKDRGHGGEKITDESPVNKGKSGEMRSKLI